MTAKRVLALVACPPSEFAAVADGLRASLPGARLDLVCFGEPDAPLPAETTVLRARPGFAFALALWLRTLARRYGAVYLATPRGAEAPPLVLGLACLLPHARVVVTDGAGRADRLGPRARLHVLAVSLATAGLLGLARAVTRIGIVVVPARVPGAPAGGRCGLVVPVCPDISHTFVYREVLELTRRHPDHEVVVLEPGSAAVVHPEAAALLRSATVLRPLDPPRYLCAYLRQWVQRPRAMAGLVRFFQPHTASFGPGTPADDALCFLRLEHLHHPNHVMAGLVLAEHLRRRGIGYLHVYGSTYPALRALVAHRLLGIPFSLSTFVDYDYVTPFHMLEAKLGLARFATVCSGFCARRLGARFPALAPRLYVLRHGLGADYATDKRLRPRDRRSRVVYVGRFVPKKGLDTLVEACALLRDRGIDVACHVYGDGELRRGLAAQVERLGLAGRVFLEGPLPNDRLPSVMNEDDLFVCASRYMPDGERDGIPVTLIEAMALGVTAVSTPVSGIPELIEDGRNGYLVPPDDPGALADCLARLLGSAELRRVVATGARETVRRRFSLERAVDLLDGWISRERASRAGATRGTPGTRPGAA